MFKIGGGGIVTEWRGSEKDTSEKKLEDVLEDIKDAIEEHDALQQSFITSVELLRSLQSQLLLLVQKPVAPASSV